MANNEVEAIMQKLFDLVIEKSLQEKLNSFFREMSEMTKRLPTRKEQAIAKRALLNSTKTAIDRILKGYEGRLFNEIVDAHFSSKEKESLGVE